MIQSDNDIFLSVENSPVLNRADIKASEIVQLNPVSYYLDPRYGLTIEIKSIGTVERGLELYARAWKGNQQLGFSEDGSVEIERFIFINPPILVDDATGTIVRTWIDRDGKTMTRTLRVDPVEALRQSLAHTIEVTAKSNNNIVIGKVGHSTLTVYPDPGSGATTVDGYVDAETSLGSGVSWATIRTAAGSLAVVTNVIEEVAFNSDTTTNNWRYLNRIIFTLDTSSLTGNAVISSAVFSLFGQFKKDDLSVTPDINIYGATPASNNNLVAADFAQTGTTEYSTTITYANYSTTAYNDFTLNATGLNNISKTGITKFSAKNANYDVSGTNPTWSSNLGSNIRFYTADQTGTANDPQLIVTYTIVVKPTTTGSNLLTLGVG